MSTFFKLVCGVLMVAAALVGFFFLYEFANAFGSPQPGAEAAAAMNASAGAESMMIFLLAMIAWLVADLKTTEDATAPAVIASKVASSVPPGSRV
jgi:hypothetical protein